MRSRLSRVILAAAVASLGLATTPAAAKNVPGTLTHQGRLFDAADKPVAATVTVSFAIYANATGGTALWTETHSVTFDDGYFSVSLGSVTPFPATLLDGSVRYLGVTVGSDVEMSPRVNVASVPYAIVAGDAIGDLHPTSITINGTTIIDSTGNWTGPTSGLQGPAGPAGTTGATGPIGPTGTAGQAGAAGAMGPVGPTGSAGAVGPQGPVGPTGANGAAGAVGPQGPVGPTGANGAAGANGATGATGATGANGGSTVLDLELEETSGTTFADSSGLGNNATAPLGGVAPGSLGHSGKSVNFSGGVLTIPAPNNIPATPQIAVEAWIQPQAPLTVSRTILGRPGSYGLRQLNTELSFQVFGATNPGTACVATSSGAGLTAGTWYHTSGWYDGVHAYLAINGVVVASTFCPNGPVVATPNAPFNVGGIYNGGTVTEPYQGAIDEVRVRPTAAAPFRARYVSPWTAVTQDSKVHSFAHGLGVQPSSCRAFWSTTATGAVKRPLQHFDNSCNGATWTGADVYWDATNASFYAYPGILFCYYDGTWYNSTSGYVQMVCEL
jgi:hypothetical protein